MLCNGWTDNSSQKNKLTVRGHGVNEASAEDTPVLSKWSKRSKRKMMKKANTVFKVSLPLTKGSLLLERTSFSKDSLPVSRSHSSASDLIPSSTEDSYLECDTESFAFNHAKPPSVCTTVPCQEDLCSGDTEAGQYMRPERNYTVTVVQEGNGYFSNNEYFSQSEDITGTKDHMVYGDGNHDGQRGSQERSRENFSEELKREGLQKQYEGLSHTVSRTQDWSSHKGYTEQWYSSAAPNKFDTRAEERRSELSLDATQHYYRQLPQNHYMAPDHSRSLLTGGLGYHGSYGGVAPHSDAAGVNMHPHSGDVLAHSVAPGTRVHYLETEQRRAQSCMEFTTSNVQTGYTVQPVAYHAVHTDRGLMHDPVYSNGPWAQHDWYFPYPERSGGGGGGDMSQSNAFTPPVQAPCYGTNFDLHSRDTGLSRFEDFKKWTSAYYGDPGSTQGSSVSIE